MSKLVLGRGLGALIPTGDASTTDAASTRTVALESIVPNPMQPRREFDDERLGELVASIKQNGMMQPLVVRANGSGYELIAGERRFRAARQAGLINVPIVVMDADSDARMLELALVENIQREDLNPLELASAYQRLMEQCKLTQGEMAFRVGKSRTAIANTLRLLTLPPSIQEMIRHGKLTEGHARAMLSLPNEAMMLELAERIVDGAMSVRDVERVTGQVRKRKLIPKRKLPILSDIETYLKQLLGTSVRIVPGLKNGRIEIEYYGDEDLDRLLDLFRAIKP